MSQPPVLCIPGFHLFFLTSSVPLRPVSIPFGRGGGGVFRDVPTSRTLHSRLPLLFLGFLSTIRPERRRLISGSRFLFGGREATTGNTSVLRKLSQATVPLSLFRLRNIQ